LTRQIHDLHGNLRVFPLDRVLLTPRTMHASYKRHFFVLLHQVVVLAAGRRIEQRLANEVEPAHLLVSPCLLFGRIFIGMVDLRYLFESMLDSRGTRVTS